MMCRKYITRISFGQISTFNYDTIIDVYRLIIVPKAKFKFDVTIKKMI